MKTGLDGLGHECAKKGFLLQLFALRWSRCVWGLVRWAFTLVSSCEALSSLSEWCVWRAFPLLAPIARWCFFSSHALFYCEARYPRLVSVSVNVCMFKVQLCYATI
jgi:hypothetical protein